jgi:MotA/TolQ/ExbB proton channel family
MDTNMNRWLVSGVWLAAVMALVSASTQGAIGVAAMWALPAALAATIAALGFPDKPMSRIVGGIAIVWELALIGAYWPFAPKDDVAGPMGPMTWPTHSLVILAVLAALALSFVAMFLLPALGLGKRLKLAIAAIAGPPAELVERVSTVLEADPALLPLWKEYLAHLREPAADAADPDPSSTVSARAVFDAATVTHARLRLDLFRNLPGIFTGIGIIGTFSGLIMGLRTFRISQNPQVVQKSLELLMAGVWEAFLISAMAITLAITVTLIEKIVMSLVARRLDAFAMALDNAYPPRPQAEGEDWLPRMLAALDALGQHNASRVPAPAAPVTVPMDSTQPLQAPLAAFAPTSALSPMQPMTAFASAGATHAAAPALPGEAMARMLDIGDHTRQAVQAMTELARSLPATLTESVQGTQQTQTQAVQAMKMLAARLEGVASGIETSGRKTLETVAARMMQSEASMVSRHQAVAEHLGEVVQRIEALCGLLQHDRVDETQNATYGFDAPGYDAPAFEPPRRYADQRRPNGGQNGGSYGGAYAPAPRHRDSGRVPTLEFEDGNEYDDGGYPAAREADGRYERGGDGGSFGS